MSKKLEVDHFAMDVAFSTDEFAEHHYFIDRETGEILSSYTFADPTEIVEELPDEPTEEDILRVAKEMDWFGDENDLLTIVKVELDPDRYVEIPHSSSHEDWEIMDAFISTIESNDLRRRLERGISGRGAFRFFREELRNHPAVEDRWERFRKKRRIEQMEDWLESIGIEPLWTNLPDLEEGPAKEETESPAGKQSKTKSSKETGEERELDREKMAEVTMALLWFNQWNDGYVNRAWKSHAWELLDRLHDRGWISSPKGKAKSVILTEAGETEGPRLLEKYFGIRSSGDS